MVKKTQNAVSRLKELAKDDPEFEKYYQEAHINVTVAQMIYDARKEAGLTQTELARRIGTTQSVISQLEDADYEGHSLTMLQRIATALNRTVKIEFEPAPPKPAELHPVR